ncbi:hypothetical protein Prudu_010071 [Prunus dulcis]|uniref:Uncharacterized protein n=1 Tax=Prunus dulcis TaxID=3755 RepID=A0A4Y1R7Q4_PRUDU|nr:hypothetical protein Prudu_010071 [Prunus dulcis]
MHGFSNERFMHNVEICWVS